MIKINGGEARSLLIFIGYKKSFIVEIGNLVVRFDFDGARWRGLFKTQPLQTLFIVAAAISDLLAFNLAGEKDFFV